MGGHATPDWDRVTMATSPCSRAGVETVQLYVRLPGISREEQKLACTTLANVIQVDRSRCVIRTRRFTRNETAKTTLIRFATGMLLLVSCALGVWAQEATATRNLILRRDPSKSSPIIGHVAKGDRLTLLQT